MRQEAVFKRIGSILLFLGPITTLAVSPSSNFDPINLIKLIFVTAFAFSVFALLFTVRSHLLDRLPTGVWISSGCFVLWMIVVVVISDSPLNQQMWGVFGRNTGFLTYFSLVIVLIGVALVQDRSFYRKLVWAIILTAIPTTLYALIQVAGKDPISWSVMAPFATLGNVNFSSAFFGLASLCATVMAFSAILSLPLRLGLLLLAGTDLLVILETGSIQGFMIYLAGIGVAGYSIVHAVSRIRFLRAPYVVLGLVGFLLTAMALKNVGPLAKFVFGETILFRFDYWFAGWAMTVNNPILGVGLDGYGDWYRQLRGEIATLRTTPDRITNTAHNIYLDISASGGFPLLFAYLALLFYAARAAFRIFRREKEFNPYFVAIFSAWVAYLIQAAISINQIGVGIWGWFFTGALIGYERVSQLEVEKREGKKPKRGEVSELPATSALFGIAGFAVGFLLAFVPFNADSNFKDALASNDATKQFETAKRTGATAYHMELSLDSAIKANNEPLAAEITAELLTRYPRDFMGWQVKQLLTTTPPAEREQAYQMLRTLDPFNPTIKQANP